MMITTTMRVIKVLPDGDEFEEFEFKVYLK